MLTIKTYIQQIQIFTSKSTCFRERNFLTPYDFVLRLTHKKDYPFDFSKSVLEHWIYCEINSEHSKHNTAQILTLDFQISDDRMVFPTAKMNW